VAEALDAAEHRHRRRRRRLPADDRLGGRDRLVSLESIVLFLIIFLWTPPHFWALALYRAGTTSVSACRCCPWSAVAVLVAVFFVVTIVRLGGNVADRPL
jgi:hypothetical protein